MIERSTVNLEIDYEKKTITIIPEPKHLQSVFEFLKVDSPEKSLVDFAKSILESVMMPKEKEKIK
jgi:hypothetical protein